MSLRSSELISPLTTSSAGAFFLSSKAYLLSVPREVR
jgi:hypothetical protein